MRSIASAFIFLITLPFSPLFEDVDYSVTSDEGPDHYSWNLGTPDNIPETEVIIDTSEQESDDFSD